MSDPVSNIEIEDVLSSIRRLISESASSDDRGRSVTGEKLVLTPAFRVHDTGSEDQDDSAAETKAPVLELVHPIAFDARKPSDTPEEPPTFSHWNGGLASPEADAQDEITADAVDHDDSAYDDAELLSGFDEMATPSGAAASEAESLENRIAELEAAVSATLGGWEPDGGEETAQAEVLKFHAARLRAEGEGRDLKSDGPSLEITDAELTDAALTDAETDSETVSETVEEPAEQKAPLAEKPLLFRSYSAQTIKADLPEVPIANRGAEQGAEQVDPLDLRDEDTDVIDEAALQALVSRLVREELQGDVGEKITRSVRSLVRREIARAFTLKGLE